MTETEQLTRQAIREIGMTMEPYNRVVMVEPQDSGAVHVTGQNRSGDAMSARISEGASYTEIYSVLRSIWRG